MAFPLKCKTIVFVSLPDKRGIIMLKANSINLTKRALITLCCLFFDLVEIAAVNIFIPPSCSLGVCHFAKDLEYGEMERGGQRNIGQIPKPRIAESNWSVWNSWNIWVLPKMFAWKINDRNP